MSEQRQTYTYAADGQPLTVEQDGVSMPANHSFACINDYVHDTDRHFEELQGLALGMACEIEKLRSTIAQQQATGYPPCDYCGAAVEYMPWHGSGLINGVESRHIHACDNCRNLLPGHEQPGSQAARDVLAERRRQVDAEGFDAGHDDMATKGQLAVAAGYYALSCGYPHERDIGCGRVPTYWPWDKSWWKPWDSRSNLVRAGALILAEIERLDRAVLGEEDGHA